MDPSARAPLGGSSFDVDVSTFGSQDLRRRLEEPQAQRCLAAVAQLTLHFASFLSNISTLVVYLRFGEMKFFGTMFAAWLLTGCVVAWAALREFKPCQRQTWYCWPLHWVWVVVVFGLLRFLQVKHIWRFFRQRQQTEEIAEQEGQERDIVPTAFNSKTFDGIIEGFFFAVGNQFAFFMLDLHPPRCEWYMTPVFGSYHWLRFVFLFSAVCSMLTLAAAIVEVDYRVSTDIGRRINDGACKGFIHFMYRASEVIINLSSINIICIFLRPQPFMQSWVGSYYLYMPIILSWLINAGVLYSSSKRHGAEQEFLVAHLVVAVASVAVNPTQFVDRPIYQEAAKSTAKYFFILRWVEFLLIVLFIYYWWNTPFPCTSQRQPGLSPPSEIGPYTLWFGHSNHPLAYGEFGLALLIHFTIIIFQPYTRKVLATCGSSDPPARTLTRAPTRAFLATSTLDVLQAEVSKSVPRGLSSFLVQAGTGVTSQLIANREYAMTDFSIEQTLGTGAWGVVVLVKALWRGGEPLPEERQKLFALKLANVTDRLQMTYAAREREYLVKLREHRHPFVMHLEHFLDVDPDQQFLDADGSIIRDGQRNCGFHKALMMEYCPRGDLESFLQRHALETPGKNRPPDPDEEHETLAEDLRWLTTARQLVGQLVEAVRFLHQENFTHRDLKPGNVLLKSGPDGRLAICLTDFGFAKEQVNGVNLESVAGNSEYMAPEIRKTWLSGDWVGDPYTPAVDLWSLGKMMLVILWDCKYWFTDPHLTRGMWTLQIPDPEADWFQGGHPRVPLCALELVKQMMQTDANRRGTAAEIARHPFFQALRHEGAELEALDFSNCQRRSRMPRMF